MTTTVDLLASVTRSDPSGVPVVSVADGDAPDETTRVVWELLLIRSAGRSKLDEAELRRAARDIGRRGGERGDLLEPCLRSTRRVGRQIWERLVATGGGTTGTALRDAGFLLWEVVDDVAAQLTEGYHAAARARFDGDEQRRAELWEGLLLGMAEDPAFATEAVRTLGLVGAPYVVIEIEDGDPVDLGRACRSASWWRRHQGSIGLVTLDSPRLGDLVGYLKEHATRPIGISAPVPDASELARALGQAAHAVRVRAGRPGVTAFEQALPDVLLLGSPEVTDCLVRAWLGPVLELPEPDRDQLLATIVAWVDTGCSASVAAQQLFCHRNTVLNRLRRLTALLGRDLSAPVPLELALAVRAVVRTRAE